MIFPPCVAAQHQNSTTLFRRHRTKCAPWQYSCSRGTFPLNNNFDCTEREYFVSRSELMWCPSEGKQHHLWGRNYAAILQHSQQAVCRPRCSLCWSCASLYTLNPLQTYTARPCTHTSAHTHEKMRAGTSYPSSVNLTRDTCFGLKCFVLNQPFFYTFWHVTVGKAQV